MTQTFRRLASVDSFRALTMMLMIFVNDLGFLRDIPEWLDHAAKTEDRMGLADVVFPAFLFIVGLSIPFAIAGRERKGLSRKSTLAHILTRSLALLIMGIFHVNLENYDSKHALLSRPVWQIGITICFFLIWLDYGIRKTGKAQWWYRGAGIALLTALALVYKGQEPGDNGQMETVWMGLQWYGILGLIGWCYLICSLLYFLIRDRLGILIGCFLFFLCFCMANKAGWFHAFDDIKPYFWLVSSGALPAMTMAGVVTSVVYRKYAREGRMNQVIWLFGGAALLALLAGFFSNHWWQISKIRATPPWVLICTGISLAVFAILIYLTDIKGQERLFSFIKPAGTSTLTCYLLPYIHYAILSWIGPAANLPWIFRTGGVGLLKSFLYALLIIRITGWMEKRKLRLSV